jgi:hypothetical protein
MTKTSILLVGFFSVSSLLALGCGDETGGDTTSSGTSSSSGESSSSSSSGAGGAGGGGMMTAAEKYCANMKANCTGANAQYPNDASCAAAAAAVPAGMDADMAGNTLGCRVYHSGAAASDAATHCPHAGPGGDGACGSICEGFCDIAVKTCATEWPDKAACMTACAAFPAAGMKYNTSFTAGNTVECRLYHLSVAATDAASATTHCPHTKVDSSTCM